MRDRTKRVIRWCGVVCFVLAVVLGRVVYERVRRSGKAAVQVKRPCAGASSVVEEVAAAGESACKEEEACATAFSAALQFERLNRLLSGPGITQDMTAEEQALRRLYFDAYNKPEIIGATGCPYDSARYRALTNAILTQAEIDLIIKGTAHLAELFQHAYDFAAGNGNVRDVHAARQIFEHIQRQALSQGDMDYYLSATRCLAEHTMLPIGLHDAATARELFQTVADLCAEKDAVALGIDQEAWELHQYWSLGGLAYCYEQLGDAAAAEAAYAQIVATAPAEKKERYALGAKYFRILNKARGTCDPRPEELRQWAGQLEALAEECRAIKSRLEESVVEQAASFRRRADILCRQNK